MYEFETRVKNVDFPFFFWKNVEIPMYETFKKCSFFNFCRKNHHQNPHRYVFEFFLYTKSISRYYRNYRLFIRYSCYQSKNFTFFFVFSIFVQKVTFKIPIGTILNFFCKKSRFLHTLEIIDFAWDNHVIYRKKFTFFFSFFNSFSP